MTKDVMCSNCGSVLEIDESDVSPEQPFIECLNCKYGIPVKGLFPARFQTSQTSASQPPDTSFEAVAGIVLKAVVALVLILLGFGFVAGIFNALLTR